MRKPAAISFITLALFPLRRGIAVFAHVYKPLEARSFRGRLTPLAFWRRRGAAMPAPDKDHGQDGDFADCQCFVRLVLWGNYGEDDRERGACEAGCGESRGGVSAAGDSGRRFLRRGGFGA